jgi:hypothetical protein
VTDGNPQLHFRLWGFTGILEAVSDRHWVSDISDNSVKSLSLAEKYSSVEQIY